MVRLGDVCNILDNLRVPITASERKPGPYPYYGANGIQDYIDDYIFDDELVLLAEDGGNFGSKEKPIAYRVSGKCWVNNHAHVLKPKDMLNVDYLCYSIMFYDVTPLISGTTRAKLNQAAVRKMSIPLPPLDIQQKIADILDKSNATMEKRRAQIDKLDLLEKAQFIEMFGIPGSDIKSWGLRELGKCCELNPNKGLDERLKLGLKISFIPMSAVSEKGAIDPSQIKDYEEVKTGFTYFAENDVLFAKITPCMENGKGAIARDLVNNVGFGSTEFHVLRPIHKVSSPYWIYTVTSFKSFRLKAAANMSGSAGQRRVTASYLNSFKISLPPIDLQNQFASFVQQVEAQKSFLQASLDKLELNHKSLMQKAFRGELF